MRSVVVTNWTVVLCEGQVAYVTLWTVRDGGWWVGCEAPHSTHKIIFVLNMVCLAGFGEGMGWNVWVMWKGDV